MRLLGIEGGILNSPFRRRTAPKIAEGVQV